MEDETLEQGNSFMEPSNFFENGACDWQKKEASSLQILAIWGGQQP